MCWEFFKTGLFAIGGGMATIPFLAGLAQNYPQWLSVADLSDMIAISESTPGPIGVNLATYVGFHVFGVWGGVAATLSLVLPSYIILILVAKALDRFMKNRFAKGAFITLRPAVTGLIAAAGYQVFRIALFREGALLMGAALLFCALLFFTQWSKTQKLHPVVWIAVAAVAGVIFQF
jgi:chromate transporter